MTSFCTPLRGSGSVRSSNILFQSIVTSLPPGHLSALLAVNKQTQSMMYARNSARNVVSHIRQWVVFCLHFTIPILPATVENLVAFLELMARSSGYSHIKTVLSSIRFLHKSLDITFPSESFQLDTTLKGLKRRLARTPFQVLPITPTILRKIFYRLDMDDMEHLATWCSFLVCFYGLFRKSSVAPETFNDTTKALSRRNFMFDWRTKTILIYVNQSEVIQFGQRDLVIPLLHNTDPAMDPWRHLTALFTKHNADFDSPAFSYAINKCITYESFTKNLKKLLKATGTNPDLYSGHSFRRGGATFLHSCGGNILQVQAAGDWSSMCFTRYLFLSLDQRISSQQLMRNNIDSTRAPM